MEAQPGPSHVTPEEEKMTSDEKPTELKEVSDVTDPFAYLSGGFTSEKYKVEVRNLPKYYGLREIRKLLNNKLKLGFSKIKIPSKGSYWIYVCFRSEEDQKEAIEKLSGFKWKGSVLIAEKAKAVPDPLIKKRMSDKGGGEVSRKKARFDKELKSYIMDVRDVVTPLWRVPYGEQLTRKEEEMANILKSLGNELIKVNPEFAKFIRSQKKKFDGLPCELLPIRYAELTSDGYRNKCEFTIGINESNGLRTIGFRLGCYSEGSVTVAPIEDAVNVPNKMKLVVRLFEKFVRDSELDVYRPVSQLGYWRQLTVRYSFRTDQLMLVVGIHPQKMTESEVGLLMTSIREFFTEGEGKSCKVNSLFLQIMDKKKCYEGDPIYLHISGKTCIYEKVLNRYFRISPQAFFQINTNATDVLYNAIAEISGLKKESTLFDICCGTGSIGISLADRCSEVLGLEVSSEAIEDAKVNASLNNVQNANFYTGKAEDILSSVAHKATENEIVAIADPPRAGLHQNAVAQIRKSQRINKLVYVSCDPKLALKNFIGLGRSTSKTYQREPLLPFKAIPIDVFPHAKHCELVVYFERVKKERGQPQRAPKTGSQKQPETGSQQQPKTGPQPDPKTEPQPETGPQPDPKTEPQPETGPQPHPKTEPQPETGPQPDPKTEPQPETGSQEQPKTGPQPDAKTEPQPEPQKE